MNVLKYDNVKKSAPQKIIRSILGPAQSALILLNKDNAENIAYSIDKKVVILQLAPIAQTYPLAAEDSTNKIFHVYIPEILLGDIGLWKQISKLSHIIIISHIELKNNKKFKKAILENIEYFSELYISDSSKEIMQSRKI